MPLILNGSTGISGIDGSAGTPSYQGTDSDTGLWYPAANTVALSTSGTEVMRIDSSGRVGIGTTSPTYTLEVATGTSGQQSLANFRTADSTAANNAGLQIFATPSATAGSRNILVSWDADGANTSGGDYFYIQKLGNSGNVELAQYSNAAMIFSTNVGTERMRITSGGNVGIGTSTPDIYSLSFARQFTVSTTTASGYSIGTFAGGSGGAGGVEFGNQTVRQAGIYSLDGSALTLYTNATNSGTALTERMRITSGGNVGIGVSSPAVTLDMLGTYIQGGSSRTDNATKVSSYRVVNIANATNPLNIIAGLSTTSQNIVYIGGNDTNFVGTAATTIRFYTGADNTTANGTERMRINSNGTVSIGNTTATYTLDVTGSIRASTYFYASGGSAGHGIYLADGSSNGLISQMSNGSASTLTYIGNQTITTSSDIRIKNNIRPTERNALDLLGQWEIVDHNWNDPSDQCENNRNSRGVWTGVIAQQIQPITPWLVNKPLEDENKDGSKNLWLVDFAYSVPLLVKAIQELKAELDTVKTELNQLKGV